MDAIDVLLTRSSAKTLAAPAPTADELATILQAAVSAPDHGHVRPWRFVLIREADRARFGEIMAQCLRKMKPEAGEAALQKERGKAFRAPLIITVAARPVLRERGIPAIEQIVATGAATANIVLAAHALGYGAVWKTGTPAYDPDVKTALGLEVTDQIIGFVYIGTRAEADTGMPRASFEASIIALPG